MGRSSYRPGLFPRYRSRLSCLGRRGGDHGGSAVLGRHVCGRGIVRATGSVASAVAEGAGAAATQSNNIDPMGYVVDTLFRSDRPDANANPQEIRAEASRIILSGMRNGDIPVSDETYLAQLVSARTGISQAGTEKRVDEVIARAKDVQTKTREAADKARKTGATDRILYGILNGDRGIYRRGCRCYCGASAGRGAGTSHLIGRLSASRWPAAIGLSSGLCHGNLSSTH
jgi:hypothetical protein